MNESFLKITEAPEQATYDRETATFTGGVESARDLSAAAGIAAACPSYLIDEDDEDYLDGARSCFNCRYRRWTADGFSCLQGFPHPSLEPA